MQKALTLTESFLNTAQDSIINQSLDAFEQELMDGGVIDDRGLIIRPKLRKAYGKLADCGHNSIRSVIGADAFLRGMLRRSKRRGVGFDDYCEQMGY